MTQEQKLKTGTTTLGIVGKGFVVLAADKRATMGNLIVVKNAQKVHKLDDYIGLTIAGSVADAQKMIRVLRAELKLHELETEKLSVRGAATLLSNILHANKWYPFFNQFILGGYQDGNGILYDMDPSGSLILYDDYTSTGSGSPIAYGVLEDSFKKNMTQEEAIKLAVRGIRAAMSRDSASGEGIDICVISKSGFTSLEPKEVEKYL